MRLPGVLLVVLVCMLISVSNAELATNPLVAGALLLKPGPMRSAAASSLTRSALGSSSRTAAAVHMLRMQVVQSHVQLPSTAETAPGAAPGNDHYVRPLRAAFCRTKLSWPCAFTELLVTAYVAAECLPRGRQ